MVARVGLKPLKGVLRLRQDHMLTMVNMGSRSRMLGLEFPFLRGQEGGPAKQRTPRLKYVS